MLKNFDFPELRKNEINSMKASEAFIKGLPRRFFNKERKIFIVGFHKTGTSSMGKALQVLGYTVCGSLKEAYNYKNEELNFKKFLLNKAKPNLNKYDAFQDTPWFLLYKELYAMYPNAYFILTTRDTSSWIKSVQKHFGKGKYKFHDMIYGSFDSFHNEKKYIDIYEEHNSDVKQFFASRGNFKVIDIDQFNWQELCFFLGVNEPLWDFPHANRSSSRGSLLNKLKKFIKDKYYN